MAIQKEITEARFNMTVPDAYLKLAYLAWNDIEKRFVATFSTWSSPTAEAEGKECISLFQVDVTELYADLQADVYNLAKTKPELSGGIDV